MAWKRRFKRRRMATQWQNAPVAFSLATGEKPCAVSPMRNLVTPGVGTKSGTLACFPAPLDLGFDDKTGAASELMQEGAVENRTLLRFVGMMRPVGLEALDQGQGFSPQGFEVRYALYRGQTDNDVSEFEATTGAVQSPDLDQPDLFSSSGLSNERIAWMRSYIIPMDYATPPSLADMTKFNLNVVQTLPWHKDAALSVIDFQSKRKISTDSRFYMLRQVRTWGSQIIGTEQTQFEEVSLVDASFGRLLTRKVRA